MAKIRPPVSRVNHFKSAKQTSLRPTLIAMVTKTAKSASTTDRAKYLNLNKGVFEIAHYNGVFKIKLSATLAGCEVAAMV